MPRCCAATLPQLGLLLLCAAWLLPGLIGHAPWKGGDGEHFVQLWLLLQSGAMPQSVSATPPLYYWVAMASAWLTSPILALADGARLASGLFIALALFVVARTARVLYGAEAGWAAALTLLGCMGLLVRGHELNAATAQFAAAAIMLYGIACLPRGRCGGWMLGGGAALRKRWFFWCWPRCCRCCWRITAVRSRAARWLGGWAVRCWPAPPGWRS